MSALERRACVIGAGLGGLALAIRLQAAGVETVLVEAQPRVGGRAASEVRDLFTFDLGPTVVSRQALLADLWQAAGHDIASDVTLLPVQPLWRFSWPDGTLFDLPDDPAALAREVARLAPGDLGGFDELLAHARALRQEPGWAGKGLRALADLSALARGLPGFTRLQGWRSVYATVHQHVASERLCEALAFPVLLAGANPMRAPAALLGDLHAEIEGGAWAVKGGTGALAQAMAALFERLGGTLRLHDPVVRIHTLGDRASEVETQSGWRERFAAVASNADPVHSYRELLQESPQGPAMARRLARKAYAPGVFSVHFALEGTWPGIPHRMALFGQRFGALFEDVFDHGVLPQDMVIHLAHPSITDPGLAPEGKSVFQAFVPVAHRGKLPIDWDAIGPLLEQRILAEIGLRLVPDLPDRIITKFHRTPRDLALDYNAYLGSAWGLEPSLTQSGALRLASRDPKIRNFYLAGSASAAAASIPAVLEAAAATAALMLEDTK